MNNPLKKSLFKRSQNALSLFRKAITEMQSINTIAETNIIENTEQITRLESENKSMNVMVSDNKYIISNIENLITPPNDNNTEQTGPERV